MPRKTDEPRIACPLPSSTQAGHLNFKQELRPDDQEYFDNPSPTDKEHNLI